MAGERQNESRMSTLRSRAYEIFQGEPSEENGYVVFSDEYGCIVPVETPENHVSEGRLKYFLDYDRKMKEYYGEDHFHGEKDHHLAIGLRMRLGWC